MAKNFVPRLAEVIVVVIGAAAAAAAVADVADGVAVVAVVVSFAVHGRHPFRCRIQLR